MQKRALIIILALVILGSLAFLMFGNNNAQPGSKGSANAVPISIEITDGHFSQQTVTLQAGTTYSLTVTNNGKLSHSLTSALVDTKELAPGESRTISFTPTTPGTYRFHCNVPCDGFHSDMQEGYSFIVS